MTHPQVQRHGLARIGHAAKYSANGLRSAWRHEAAFRQEATLCLLMLPSAFWIATSWVVASLLVGTLVLVLVVELLNTAVEAVVDRIGPEWNELSGRAKDVGSAAVMLSLLLAAGVWATALWQRLAA